MHGMLSYEGLVGSMRAETGAQLPTYQLSNLRSQDHKWPQSWLTQEKCQGINKP